MSDSQQHTNIERQTTMKTAIKEIIERMEKHVPDKYCLFRIPVAMFLWSALIIALPLILFIIGIVVKSFAVLVLTLLLLRWIVFMVKAFRKNRSEVESEDCENED